MHDQKSSTYKLRGVKQSTQAYTIKVNHETPNIPPLPGQNLSLYIPPWLWRFSNNAQISISIRFNLDADQIKKKNEIKEEDNDAPEEEALYVPMLPQKPLTVTKSQETILYENTAIEKN